MMEKLESAVPCQKSFELATLTFCLGTFFQRSMHAEKSSAKVIENSFKILDNFDSNFGLSPKHFWYGFLLHNGHPYVHKVRIS